MSEARDYTAAEIVDTIAAAHRAGVPLELMPTKNGAHPEFCYCDRCASARRVADLRRGLVTRTRAIGAAMWLGAIVGVLAFAAFAFWSALLG
jgi:hypothetical protein